MPEFSLVGCWIMLILNPWNEPWAVVDERLGSKLSNVPAVKISFCMLEGYVVVARLFMGCERVLFLLRVYIVYEYMTMVVA